MDTDDWTRYVESLGDVLTLKPIDGDGSPPLAWGDRFFYYAPDGVLPPGQPFATIVTKDYPDEPAWSRGEADAFRVNVDAKGSDARAATAAEGTQETETIYRDRVMAHPVYGTAGWVCVINPGETASRDLQALLGEAHSRAARSWHRRHEETPPRTSTAD